jgi:AAA domain, putative AbiEii toxin, Type IV TA system/P-loop containing region of AAA domain
VGVRVVSVDLDNWRGFTRQRIDFHPAATVLLGENGSGKSSVLEAVAMALDPCVNRVASTFRIPAGAVRSGQERGAVELTFEHLGRRAVQRTECLPQGNAVGASHPAPSGPPWPVAVLYGTERTVRDLTPRHPDATTAFGPEVEQNTALDPQGVSFERLFVWFQERENLENERRVDSPEYRDPQVAAVRTAVARMTGFSALRVRRAEAGGKSRLTVSKADEQLMFDQLSSGERAMVALVADLARRLAIADPGRPDPLNGEAVVLVDEIDLHLHPRWQRTLIGRLRETFPGVQWIATTHSPIVAMHLERQSVRLLRDFQLVETPATYGRDANALYADLFGVPERPDDTFARLNELGEKIEAGEYGEAARLLDDLAGMLGENDPTVVGQRVFLEMSR